MVKIRFDLDQLHSGFTVPLLILVTAVGGYFLVLPKYKDAKVNKQMLQIKQDEVELKEAQLLSVEELLSSWKKNKEELKILDDALPDAPRVPELLVDIESLANASGLLISNLLLTIPPAAEVAKDQSQQKKIEGLLNSTDNLIPLQIILTLKGDYPGVKSFLTNLEQNLRLIDVFSLNFAAVQTETESQTFVLKLQTYYYKK